MKSFAATGAKGRRQLRQVLNAIRRRSEWVTEPSGIFVRGEASFRIIERLHRAGLVTACMTKHNLFGKGRRPFREIVVYASEKDVWQGHLPILPRR
jgi:hypothetical protein